MRLNNILLEDSNSMYMKLRRQLLNFKDEDAWILDKTFNVDNRIELWCNREGALYGLHNYHMVMDDDWPEHLPDYFMFGKNTGKIKGCGWIKKGGKFQGGGYSDDHKWHREDGPASISYAYEGTRVARQYNWRIRGTHWGMGSNRDSSSIPEKYLNELSYHLMSEAKDEVQKKNYYEGWKAYPIAFKRLVESVNKITDGGYMNLKYRNQWLEAHRRNKYIHYFEVDISLIPEELGITPEQIDDDVEFLQGKLSEFNKMSIELVDDPRYKP